MKRGFIIFGESDKEKVKAFKRAMLPYVRAGMALLDGGEGYTAQWGHEQSVAVITLDERARAAAIEAARKLGQEALLEDTEGVGFLLWLESGKREKLGRRVYGKSPEAWSSFTGLGTFHYR